MEPTVKIQERDFYAYQRGTDSLDAIEVADWTAQYQVLLQQGWQANPADGVSNEAAP